MSRRVTLSDVAAAAKVDVSLVSRVLRHEDVKVREETRQRIFGHAERLGYRPNAIARSLKTAHAGAFGLVIPTFNNPVYAQIIAGAEAAAAQLGKVMMTTSSEGWVGSDLDDSFWLDALDGGRVDGLLIAGGSAIDVRRLQVPYILVNRAIEGVQRSVVLDDAKASRIAVDHLVDLGHRRIVFLGGPDSADTAARRLAGFKAARKAAGLPVLGQQVHGDYTAAGGRVATERLLATGAEFTAVVAANLPSGIGALQAMAAAGIDVPGSMSVVAIHDAEVADWVQPSLTTVRMPLARLGERGIELLNTVPARSEIEEVVDQPMELRARASTASPPEQSRS